MKKIETIDLPSASPGTRNSLRVIRYGAPGSSPKVYIQAGLHADEAPGFAVAHQLEKLFDSAEIVGEIVLVPVANPLGLSQWRDEMLHGRFHFATSINFNRQHLDIVDDIAGKIAHRLSPDAESNVSLIRRVTAEILGEVSPEDDAGFLKKQLLSLAHDADIVLDLHCDYDAILHLYMGTPLWPGGADLAAQLQADIVLLAINSGDNPFDEACSRLWWELSDRFPGRPIPPACLAVTVELRGIRDTEPGIAENDAQNIYTFLQRRKIIRGTATEPPPLRNEGLPLTGVDYIKAHAPGVVVFHRKPGDWVKAGEVVAEIINPLPEGKEEPISLLKSSTEGLLFTRIADRLARPGRIVAKVAGRTPLRSDEGNLLTP